MKFVYVLHELKQPSQMRTQSVDHPSNDKQLIIHMHVSRVYLPCMSSA